MSVDTHSLFNKHNLRHTTTRQLVLDALTKSNQPLTCKQIHEQLPLINLVTIYRIIETFLAIGLVHRCASNGGFVSCAHVEQSGHHVLLSCTDCGTVHECVDATICKQEDALAAQIGFTPNSHITEILGHCSLCS